MPSRNLSPSTIQRSPLERPLGLATSQSVVVNQSEAKCPDRLNDRRFGFHSWETLDPRQIARSFLFDQRWGGRSPGLPDLHPKRMRSQAKKTTRKIASNQIRHTITHHQHVNIASRHIICHHCTEYTLKVPVPMVHACSTQPLEFQNIAHSTRTPFETMIQRYIVLNVCFYLFGYFYTKPNNDETHNWNLATPVHVRRVDHRTICLDCATSHTRRPLEQQSLCAVGRPRIAAHFGLLECLGCSVAGERIGLAPRTGGSLRSPHGLRS